MRVCFLVNAVLFVQPRGNYEQWTKATGQYTETYHPQCTEQQSAWLWSTTTTTRATTKAYIFNRQTLQQVSQCHCNCNTIIFGWPLQVTVPYVTGPVSVLSVCKVGVLYCGQTVVGIKMPLGIEVGLGPGEWRHCVRWGPSSPTETGTAGPHFSAHVCYGKTVAVCCPSNSKLTICNIWRLPCPPLLGRNLTWENEAMGGPGCNDTPPSPHM